MANRNARVGGTYTVFHWQNQLIAYANSIQVTRVAPVVEPQPIQPMNATRPLEIVTPRASTNGTIIVTKVELWGKSIWSDMADIANSNDIVDIFEHVANLGQAITVTKFIRAPAGSGQPNDLSETFHGVIVADIDDGETVDVTTLSIPKTLTLWYTYSVKSWVNAPVRAALIT